MAWFLEEEGNPFGLRGNFFHGARQEEIRPKSWQ